MSPAKKTMVFVHPIFFFSIFLWGKFVIMQAFQRMWILSDIVLISFKPRGCEAELGGTCVHTGLSAWCVSGCVRVVRAGVERASLGW